MLLKPHPTKTHLGVTHPRWLNYNYTVWVLVVCTQTPARAPEIPPGFPPHTCSKINSDFQAVSASPLQQLQTTHTQFFRILSFCNIFPLNVFLICSGFLPRTWHADVLKAQLFSGSLNIWWRGRACRRSWRVLPTLLLEETSSSLSSLRDGATWTVENHLNNANKYCNIFKQLFSLPKANRSSFVKQHKCKSRLLRFLRSVRLVASEVKPPLASLLQDRSKCSKSMMNLRAWPFNISTK